MQASVHIALRAKQGTSCERVASSSGRVQCKLELHVIKDSTELATFSRY